jgi:hypothetical protein
VADDLLELADDFASDGFGHLPRVEGFVRGYGDGQSRTELSGSQ